ncbi:MAG: ubiquinone biosynthesis regulatory protein kinase UbiB, partial [Betaproteobacteria bacterium]|nr:ubiquinone biosynthesis regulatory protein kinase UbiB [Betaproteobacteria bacterium]
MKFRLLAILRCIARHRLDSLLVDAFPSLGRRFWFRAALALAPQAPLKEARGERLRKTFESLGPIFVKFGQLLSTRRDLLPEDIADALAKLQDSVAAFDSDLAIAEIERGLGRPIQEVYEQFDATPIASASISQV